MESFGMCLLLLCGCVVTVRTRFVQLRRPFSAIRLLRQSGGGGVSPYEAFATSLGACIGTGNIAGVAGAILLGGPGTLVWMWISALLCSASKYAEIRLALRCGGTPMDYMEQGLPRFLRFLSPLYALVCMIACLTMGNLVQVNAVTEAACAAAPAFDVRLPAAAFFTLLTALVTFGGAKRVGRAAAFLVPVMSVLYTLGALALIAANLSRLPHAIARVAIGAFSPRAVTGGVAGFLVVLRIGVSRGVFTHEAGLGTAALAHGAAHTNNPHMQALLGVLEVFIDTIVLCTLTALAILVSDIPLVFGSDAANGSLVIAAFSSLFGRRFSSLFIAGSLALFAFTSIQSFSLYGTVCAQRLFGSRARTPFRLLFCMLLPLGAFLDTSLAWRVSELANALMAIVNAAALLLLNFPAVSRMAARPVPARVDRHPARRYLHHRFCSFPLDNSRFGC